MICDLNRMHEKPGLYVVSCATGTAVVEIDESKACYQLKLGTFERDGQLSRHGWNHPSSEYTCIGLFARPAS